MVRVSYPDLIGVDRGRDVLLDVLPAAMEHGLAFCRAVYHTSPMGDVVPVPGGLEAGLPDIAVFPDLSSLTALPWEPHAAWCIGEAFAPGGEPAPEAPRTVVRRVAERISALGYELACGPELEFYLCEQAPDGRWRRYADDPGNVYVVGRKGDPQGLLLSHAQAATRRRTAGDGGQPRVLARPVRDQPGSFRRWSTRPTGRSGSSPPCRRSRASAACWPRSWPSRSTTRAGRASTCTSR